MFRGDCRNNKIEFPEAEAGALTGFINRRINFRGASRKGKDLLPEAFSQESVEGRFKGTPATSLRQQSQASTDFRDRDGGELKAVAALTTYPSQDAGIRFFPHQLRNDIGIQEYHFQLLERQRRAVISARGEFEIGAALFSKTFASQFHQVRFVLDVCFRGILQNLSGIGLERDARLRGSDSERFLGISW